MMLAFTLKAVLPAGFMPGHKDGLMALVICSGMGEKTIFVPAEENAPAPQDHRDGKAEKSVCAYQAVVSGKTLIPTPVVAFATPIAVLSHEIEADEQRPLSSLSRSFEARGPPRA